MPLEIWDGKLMRISKDGRAPSLEESLERVNRRRAALSRRYVPKLCRHGNHSFPFVQVETG